MYMVYSHQINCNVLYNCRQLQFVFSFLRHFGTGVSKFCEISICRRARALVLSVVTRWAWPLRARG